MGVEIEHQLHHSFHRKSFREVRRGHSGASVSARLFVLEDSWLVKPRKERRSDLLLGVGNLDTASVMWLLMVYPSGVTVYPANETFCWENWNLSGFSEILRS